MVALFFTFTLFILPISQQKKRLCFTVGVVLALVVFLFITNFYAEIPLLEERNDSLEVRWHLWQATSKIIASSPWIGIGGEQFLHQYCHYRSPEEYIISQGRLVTQPHNSFLYIWMDSGLIVSLLFFCLLLNGIWRLLVEDSPWLQVAAYSLMVFSIISFFSTAIIYPANGLLLAIFLGFTAREKFSPITKSFNITIFFTGIIIAGVTISLLFQTISDTYLAQGQRFLQQGKYEIAAKYMEKSTSYHENSFNLTEKGRAYLALQNFPKSIDALHKSITIGPGMENAHISLALAYSFSGLHHKASEILEQAATLFPASPECFYNLGKIYNLKGNGEKAHQAFQKAAKNKSDYKNSSAFLLNLAFTKELMGQQQQALLSYIDVKKKFPQDKLSAFYIGRIFRKLGLADQSLHHLQESLKAANHNVIRGKIYYEIGKVYQHENKLEKAKDAFKYSLALNPLIFDGYHNLGQILEDQNKFADSQRIWTAYQRKFPMVALPYLYLARTSHEQRNKKLAHSYILQAQTKADFMQHKRDKQWKDFIDLYLGGVKKK
jgi:tetratricopeptide (TPR) repeat protein